MRNLVSDLRYAVRVLLKARTFTTTALLTLTLGIGTATAIFSVINAVLLRDLALPSPNELVQVRPQFRRSGDIQNWLSYPNYRDLHKESRSFAGLAAYRHWLFNITGGGTPEATIGLTVSSNFFETIGAAPLLGRTFDSHGPIGERVVVLSHDLWVRRFGEDRGILGRAVTLDDKDYTVVGVMPTSFNYPLSTPHTVMLPTQQMQLWVPFDAAVEKEGRADTNFWVVGRLKPEVTLAQARTDAASIAAQLEKRFPKSNRGVLLNLTTLREFVTGDVRQALLLLLGAVLVLLLIACVNVANLMLARATVRSQEAAIRAALGAGRVRLVRQFLTESLVLSLSGGLAGVLLSAYGLSLIQRVSAESIPRLNEASVDGRVLLFSLGLTIATGLLFGIVPAIQASRANVNRLLLDGGGRATVGRRRSRMQHVLITGQIALALVLLVGAMLLGRSFLALQRVNPGFDATNVLTGWIMLPDRKYPEGDRQKQFFEQVSQQMAQMPGVTCAGLVSALPLSGISNGTEVTIEGAPAPPPNAPRPNAELRIATPNYFCAIGVSLVNGRPFNERDRDGTMDVAIVNEVAARHFWPNQDPIGKRLSTEKKHGAEVWRQVVGVVKSTRHTGLQSTPGPELYVPYLQFASPIMVAAVRATGEPTSVMTPLRQAVAQVDKDQPVFNLRPMEELLEGSVSRHQFQAWLLALFGTMALFLAGIGIYGVISYLVTQRTREFVIRIALGATHADITRIVLRRAMLLAIAGTTIGLIVAFVAAQAIGSLLFGVSAVDITSFALASTLITLTCFGASYMPANRASRIAPASALRAQ